MNPPDRVVNAKDLLDAVAEAITDARQGDPIATVTLLVDSASVGTAFRRQLVTSGRVGAGVAGLRLMTLQDLVMSAATITGVSANQLASQMMRDVVVERLLATEPGAFEAVKDHPSTALRLSQLMAEFEWCHLDESVIDRLDETDCPATAVSVLDFIVAARGELRRQAGILPLADVAARVATSLAGDPAALARVTQQLGRILVVAQSVPADARELLDVLASESPVHSFEMASVSDPVPDVMLDVPDPGTEVSLAVRGAVGAIAAGTRPERIAIAYSTPQPYLSQIAYELEAAGIAWHGATDVALDTTALARALDTLLEMAANRDGGSSGMTRPLLMRWLAIGRVFDGADSLPTERMRRLIREEGLFGDARNWFERLDVMATYSPLEHGEGEVDEVDPSAAARERQRIRAAESSGQLLALLKRLDPVVTVLAEADTYSRGASTAWSALETFHLGTSWWQVDPSERQAHERIRELLTDEIPALDGFTDSSAGIAEVTALVKRDLGGRRGWHGQMGTGIYVGSLTGLTVLQFDHVHVLGAAEGLLPPTTREDSLLPDAARLALRRSPDDLRISTDRAEVFARAFRSIVDAAQSSTVTRPRGALPKGAIARPSRHLPEREATVGASGVSSRRASYRENAFGYQADSTAANLAWPVVAAELAIRGLMRDPDARDDQLRALVQAEKASLYPGFDSHHGNLAAWVTEEPVWEIAGRGLSASAIEAFLHCPYHFFVKRILGIDTDTVADEIDVIAPSDFGTMLHSALEGLFTVAKAEGWLPAAGQPWPAQARDRLTALFNDQVTDAKARGLTGWEPSWNATYDMVTSTFEEFLALDAVQTRSEPPMFPAAAELTFGFEGGASVEFTLDSGQVVALRGAIDRLDKSDDGRTVGVVDYKSGKSDSFEKALGIATGRAAPQERQKVQDLVYDVAARALFDDVEDVKVRFSFVPNKGTPAVVDANHTDDRAGVLRELLGRMEVAGRTGRFAPNPQGQMDYCEVCSRLRQRAGTVQVAYDRLLAAEEAHEPDGVVGGAEPGTGSDVVQGDAS